MSGKSGHLDSSIIGRELDRTEFGPVTAEQIIRYARAYGETDPIYTDEAADRDGETAECDLLLESEEGDRLVTGTATIVLAA